MEIYDFSECKYSNRNGSYGGAAGDKDGILINDEPWIAKYPKSNEGMAKSDKLSTKIPASQVKLLKNAVEKNIALVEKNLSTIIDFIKSIPNEHNGYEIITEPRREYYLKSFMTRFEDVLKKRIE